MKTSLKKLVAGASIVALVAMNTTFATSITFTGSVTGGATNTDVEYDTSTKIGTGSATVNVSASVLPVLSMALTGNAVDFGELTPDVAKAATTTTALLVNTNANNGYTIQVANDGLKSGADEIPAAGVDENLTTGYGYGITAAVDAGTTIDTVASSAATVVAKFDGIDNTAVSGMGAAQNLVTAGGPVSAQTTTVTYRARVSALQPTGNYTDTVTYTITGSF